MHHRRVLEIDDLLGRCGGVASRARLLTVASRGQLDHELRAGRLVAPFPRAYCRPWEAEFVRERAALTSVGPPAALSHLTALRRWQLLPAAPEAPIHLSVPANRGPGSRRGLIVHRVATLPAVASADALPTVHPADAIVSSWSLLAPRHQREPAITGVRRRLITTDHLQAALTANPRAAGRAQLAELVGLLEAGCESELEIWGLLGVFDVPGLRHGKRQLWVSTPAGPYRVNLGFDAEKVAVEMDGARFHSSPEQRERDMQRDAALASVGWLTLRFSHQRLHDDVAGCRRDTLAALAARRR